MRYLDYPESWCLDKPYTFTAPVRPCTRGISPSLVVIQRGNNRQAVFYCADDYQQYLDALAHAAEENGCAIHAYVLMTHHIHLLVTPSSEQSVSKMLRFQVF
ncbi:transposase [Sulfuriflexus mobilis]|uniref:transposase n=1 Tax=Sulfuriflexus mobilis TaxID=1811807 RepID=UPI003B845E63